jgi:hypothetical protein
MPVSHPRSSTQGFLSATVAVEVPERNSWASTLPRPSTVVAWRASTQTSRLPETGAVTVTEQGKVRLVTDTVVSASGAWPAARVSKLVARPSGSVTVRMTKAGLSQATRAATAMASAKCLEII